MILNTLLLLLSSFFCVYFAIKKIIYISHKKRLFDEPTELRKIHLHNTPNLGGVAIFLSFLFISCSFIPVTTIPHVNYLIVAGIILFALGLTDDLVGVNPLKKFAAQLFIAILISCSTNLRFDHGLYSVIGISSLPYWAGIALTSFFILFIINAMNLIDGINGLAAGIGLMAALAFSYLFWSLKDSFFLELSVILSGCLAGFLVFNISPARIFLGDTGSLFLGLLLSLFSIQLIESKYLLLQAFPVPLTQNPVIIVFSLLIIPILDTVRVIIIRLLHRRSPFVADRNHIHHVLLDIGFSHMQATGILIAVNVSVIGISAILASQNTYSILIVITVYMGSLLFILQHYRKSSSTYRNIIPRNTKVQSRTHYSFFTLKSGKISVENKNSLAK